MYYSALFASENKSAYSESGTVLVRNVAAAPHLVRRIHDAHFCFILLAGVGIIIDAILVGKCVVIEILNGLVQNGEAVDKSGE